MGQKKLAKKPLMAPLFKHFRYVNCRWFPTTPSLPSLPSLPLAQVANHSPAAASDLLRDVEVDAQLGRKAETYGNMGQVSVWRKELS